MSIAATISILVQPGPDDWRMRYITKVFDNEDTFETVFNWARQVSDPRASISINDIRFSEIDE